MTLTIREVLVRYGMDCYSVPVYLIFFFMIFHDFTIFFFFHDFFFIFSWLELRAWEKKSMEVRCSLSVISGIHALTGLSTDDINLDLLTRVMFARFSFQSCFSPHFHTLLFGSKSLSPSCTQGGEGRIKVFVLKWEYLHVLLGILL